MWHILVTEHHKHLLKCRDAEAALQIISVRVVMVNTRLLQTSFTRYKHLHFRILYISQCHSAMQPNGYSIGLVILGGPRFESHPLPWQVNPCSSHSYTSALCHKQYNSVLAKWQLCLAAQLCTGHTI